MTQLTKCGLRIRSVHIRYRYIFLLATVFFGSSFLIISITNRTEIMFIDNDQILSTTEFHQYDVQSEARFTIKTEGCTIPGLLALDESIKSYNQPPVDLKSCRNANFSLLQYNDSYIWIDREMFHYYNVPSEHNISCCYKSFYRPLSVENVYSETVDDRVEYAACINFTDYIEVAHEFVKVTCDFAEITLYEQFYLFARKKPMHRLGRNRDYLTSKTQDAPYYNVIVMGIDAISRLNFHRTMPKTLAYLKKKLAIELMGYNKVGDNTFPNLTPMLLGITETDLKRTCWPHFNANFDNCPFIWELYKEAGYYTALGEDSARLGTFNFGKFGFIKSPTDYYIRTFVHEAEMHVGNNKDFNSYICMGNRYFYKVLLDYIGDIFSTLKHSKLFGFFWEVSMSHDYLNYPMAMDESYEFFLKRLDSYNYLDNTVLILLSDHGIRWGGIRLTKQGRLEERLPFVQILLPSTFQENYNLAYKNIQQNSKALTTPFDIYATLYDLINLNAITDDKIKRRSETAFTSNRSISLFLPIPRNRTCKMAGIEDHWCTCHKGIKMHSATYEARIVAGQLVKQLQDLLVDHPQCAMLSLAEVLDVTEMFVGKPSNNEIGWREYMVVIRTTPGDGVFEGTLRQQNDKWNLAGTISRLNLYGDQSRCINHYQLKLYCYCY